MADRLQRYRVPTGWLVVGRAMAVLGLACVGVVAFQAISSGLGSVGRWWAVVLPLGWLVAAVYATVSVVVDPDRGVIVVRPLLGWARSRPLADLRGVERNGTMVNLVFDRRTYMFLAGPWAEELVAQVRRLQPELDDPAVRAFTIVLRGYDRAQVDDYRRRFREHASSPAGPDRPTFRVVLRGYARAEVDRAVAELTSAG